jgi:hypothetical protein
VTTFTPEEFKVLQVLGKIVILRRPSNAVMPDYVAAQVVSYDPQKGRAALCTAGQGYNLADVPYSKDLNKPGTWCFREDLALMVPKPAPAPKPTKKAAATAPASSKSGALGSP